MINRMLVQLVLIYVKVVGILIIIQQKEQHYWHSFLSSSSLNLDRGTNMNVAMFNDENIFSQNLLKQSLNDIFIKKEPIWFGILHIVH